MASSPSDDAPLRRLMTVGGGVALLAWAAWVATRRPEIGVVQVGAFVTTAAVPLAGLVRRVPAAAVAVLAGIASWLLVIWSYDVVSFPAVDMVRPWGMEKEPYPVTRPMVGLLLVVATLPVLGVAAPVRRRLHRALRFAGVCGCALMTGWWLTTQWFEMDLVSEEGVFPELPQNLPLPGRVGAGVTPIVVDGSLTHLHWTEYAYSAMPARAVPWLALRERVLADIAHGMHAEGAAARVRTGALDATRGAFEARLRATLWTIQRAAGTAHLYLQVGSLPVWALLAGAFAWGRPIPAWMLRVVTILLGVLVASVPAVNLGLVVVLFGAGLPDAARGGLEILAESAVLLLATVGIFRGARRVAEGLSA